MERIGPSSEFVAHSTEVRCATIGPKTRALLATGGEDCKVNVWNYGNSSNVWSLGNNKSAVEVLCFEPGEQNIVSGAANGSLKVFDLNEGRLARNLGGHQVNVSSIMYHPYGEFIVSGSMDSTMKVWDVRNKSCIQTYTGHDKEVTCVRFSPDGKWVASAAKDGQLLLWDLVAGKLLQTLRLQPAWARSFEFHPSELILAAITSARTVRLWDLESMSPLCASSPDSSQVRALAFVPGAQQLCSATKDGVKVWGWEAGAGTAGWTLRLRGAATVLCEGVTELRAADDGDTMLGCSCASNFVSTFSVGVPDIVRAMSVREGLGLANADAKRSSSSSSSSAAGDKERPPFSVIGSPELIARARSHGPSSSSSSSAAAAGEAADGPYRPPPAYSYPQASDAGAGAGAKETGPGRAGSPVRISPFASRYAEAKGSSSSSSSSSSSVSPPGTLGGGAVGTRLGAKSVAPPSSSSSSSSGPGPGPGPGPGLGQPQVRVLYHERHEDHRQASRAAQSQLQQHEHDPRAGGVDMGVGAGLAGVGVGRDDHLGTEYADDFEDDELFHRGPSAGPSGRARDRERERDRSVGEAKGSPGQEQRAGGRAASREAKAGVDMATSMGASFLLQAGVVPAPSSSSVQPQGQGQGHGQGQGQRAAGRYDAAACEAQLDRMLAAGPTFTSMLSTRLTSLRLLRRLWEKGDLAGVLDLLASLHESSRHDQLQLCLLADFLCAVELRGNGLCLDSCVKLLPLLDDMLSTAAGAGAGAGSSSSASPGTHVAHAALRSLCSLCEAFGDLIRVTRGAVSGGQGIAPGLDLSREERLSKCNACWSVLARVRGQLPFLRGAYARSHVVFDALDRFERLVHGM